MGNGRRGWLLCTAVLFAACGDAGATGGTGGGGAGGGAVCCGCLCADETWSCTTDTCLDAEGHVPVLAPEFGLFELPGGTYTSFGADGQVPRARVSYSFQPAEQDPEHKPLMVLFNGGPGGPALGVLALNIGHFTFDPRFSGDQPYAENPYRWTEFANLLFIDQPGTGYGYNLPRADGSAPPLRFDSGADAADYLRVLFRFVERHPALADAPIVIMGESYGGMRASHMTGLMLDYPKLAGGGTYVDPELHDEVLAFLGRRRTDLAPDAWTPADIVEVFQGQIMIQPFLTEHQRELYLRALDDRRCLKHGYDPFECDTLDADSAKVVDAVVALAVDPTLISEVLRVDITTVAWLYADARKGAYPRSEAQFLGNGPVDLSKLTAVFGAPEEGDAIYAFQNPDTRLGMDIFENFDRTDLVLRSLHDVPTFITAGDLDLYFGPVSLPPALALHTEELASATVDTSSPAGVERPGELVLTYQSGLPYGGGTRAIRFPPYYAGHSVSHRAPAELSHDVAAWLAAGP